MKKEKRSLSRVERNLTEAVSLRDGMVITVVWMVIVVKKHTL